MDQLKISYLTHALERLSNREIEKDFVGNSVRHPDQAFEDESRFVAHKKHFDRTKNKKYLYRIFYEKTKEEIIIVSAYKTSKIHKYWKEEA